MHASTQAQRLREQQSECSFKPTLDPKSEKLAASRRDPSRPISEQLVNAKAEYTARRKAAAQAALAEADQFCTFRPELTARGRRLQTSPTSGDEKRGPHARAPSGPRVKPVPSVDRECPHPT